MRIEIQHLSKQYKGGHHVLRDIDLTIGNGMFGLLGPNGAGKTTLIKILVTLLTPTTGEVRFDHLGLQHDRAQIRRLIGYLSQDFSRFPKLAIWEFHDYAHPSQVSTAKRTDVSVSTACWSRSDYSRCVTLGPASCRAA